MSVAPSGSAQQQPPAPQAPAGTLVKVVILSRHGVRSPLVDPSVLAAWTSSPWPVWLCPDADPNWQCGDGDLTPRGASLAEQMGESYRNFYRFFSAGCPTPDELFFWADTDERTLATGDALLHGLVPGCRPAAPAPWPYLHSHQQASKEDQDKIFHPVTNNSCKLDPVRAEEAMVQQAGGSLASFLDRVREPMITSQCTLQCCLRGNCDKDDWWRACGLQQKPPACLRVRPKVVNCRACFLHLPDDDAATRVEFGGAARIASTFAELLLLEYANGFPDGQVGFGRAGSPDVSAKMFDMFRLHTEAFAIEQRTPYIARLQGSRLLRKILLALQGGNDGSGEGIAPANAKFVAFVGHDTSIANVASMLNVHWKQPAYQQDQTPPAGALIFELHRTPDEQRTVSAHYVAQTPDDMRKLQGTNPYRSILFGNVSLDDFAALVTQALDPDQSCWK